EINPTSKKKKATRDNPENTVNFTPDLVHTVQMKEQKAESLEQIFNELAGFLENNSGRQKLLVNQQKYYDPDDP
ncbi:4944_t:CDS:2, partial [Gigaspora margarita]